MTRIGLAMAFSLPVVLLAGGVVRSAQRGRRYILPTGGFYYLTAVLLWFADFGGKEMSADAQPGLLALKIVFLVIFTLPVAGLAIGHVLGATYRAWERLMVVGFYWLLSGVIWFDVFFGVERLAVWVMAAGFLLAVWYGLEVIFGQNKRRGKQRVWVESDDWRDYIPAGYHWSSFIGGLGVVTAVFYLATGAYTTARNLSHGSLPPGSQASEIVAGVLFLLCMLLLLSGAVLLMLRRSAGVSLCKAWSWAMIAWVVADSATRFLLVRSWSDEGTAAGAEGDSSAGGLLARALLRLALGVLGPMCLLAWFRRKEILGDVRSWPTWGGSSVAHR